MLFARRMERNDPQLTALHRYNRRFSSFGQSNFLVSLAIPAPCKCREASPSFIKCPPANNRDRQEQTSSRDACFNSGSILFPTLSGLVSTVQLDGLRKSVIVYCTMHLYTSTARQNCRGNSKLEEIILMRSSNIQISRPC